MADINKNEQNTNESENQVQKTKKIFEKSNKDYNIVQTKGVSE